MSTRKWFGWVIAAAGLGAMLYIFTRDEPRLPIAVANGSFANAEIGTVVLLNGEMKASGQSVRYVVETDKVGPYVLPTGYVGVSGHSFVIDRGSVPLKLRLDSPARPRRLDLNDVARSTLISFKRVDGS